MHLCGETGKESERPVLCFEVLGELLLHGAKAQLSSNIQHLNVSPAPEIQAKLARGATDQAMRIPLRECNKSSSCLDDPLSAYMAVPACPARALAGGLAPDMCPVRCLAEYSSG